MRKIITLILFLSAVVLNARCCAECAGNSLVSRHIRL